MELAGAMQRILEFLGLLSGAMAFFEYIFRFGTWCHRKQVGRKLFLFALFKLSPVFSAIEENRRAREYYHKPFKPFPRTTLSLQSDGSQIALIDRHRIESRGGVRCVVG